MTFENALMFTLEDIREALGAELLHERPGSTDGFSAVANDSRVANPGELLKEQMYASVHIAAPVGD